MTSEERDAIRRQIAQAADRQAEGPAPPPVPDDPPRLTPVNPLAPAADPRPPLRWGIIACYLLAALLCVAGGWFLGILLAAVTATCHWRGVDLFTIQPDQRDATVQSNANPDRRRWFVAGYLVAILLPIIGACNREFDLERQRAVSSFIGGDVEPISTTPYWIAAATIAIITAIYHTRRD